jgi:hypothetical protein
MGIFSESKDTASRKKYHKKYKYHLDTATQHSGTPEHYILPHPKDEFIIGVEQARHLDNNKLISKLREWKNKKDFRTLGYTYEATKRNLILPAGLKKVTDRTISPLFDKQKINPYNQNGVPLGIGLTNMGLGLGLMKAVSTEEDKDIRNYIAQLKENDPVLRSVKMKRALHPIMSYYDPTKNLVSSGGDLSVAAHEFGHAKNTAQRVQRYGERLGKFIGTTTYAGLGDILPRGVGRMLGPLGMIPMATIGATALLLSNKEDKDEGPIMKAVRKHPYLTGLGLMSPKLIEEGSASARALVNISKYAPNKSLLGAAGKLGLAFGTYLAASLLPGTSLQLIERIRKHRQEFKNKLDPKKALTKTSASTVETMLKDVSDNNNEWRKWYTSMSANLDAWLPRIPTKTAAALEKSSMRISIDSSEGRAGKEGKIESDFDPKLIQQGMKVESEHTNNPKLQKHIAMDHLTEDKDYYNKLKKMEKK